MLAGLLSFNSMADDCRSFSKHEFTGVFNVAEYICDEETQTTPSCYSQGDRYQSVSEVMISTLPLYEDVALSVKLMSYESPSWPQLIDQFIFSESQYSQSHLTCTKTTEEGVTVLKIKSELSSGSSRFFMSLTKRGDLIEVENFASSNSVSSRRVLRLKN